jgi:hypothetical protein
MGEAESNYIQVNAQRQISDTNFRQGVIDYSFSLAGNQRASMKKSYVRIRAKLTTTGGAQPTLADKVAFAENWANNLFSSAYFYAGGVDISSKQNFCAQSSMARTRLSSTYGWFKSIGDVYGFDSNFSRRAAEIASDGKTDISYFNAPTGVSGTTITPTGELAPTTTPLGTLTLSAAYVFAFGDVITVGTETVRIVERTSGTVFTVETLDGSAVPTVGAGAAVAIVSVNAGFVYDVDDGKNDIEIVFQPGALGIWETESCLPSGQYRLSLYPNNDKDLTAGIEAKNLGVDAGDYKITVSDMYLYLHTYRAVEPIVNGHYYLDLNEMSTQVKTLNTPVNNNFNLTIPPSTFGEFLPKNSIQIYC